MVPWQGIQGFSGATAVGSIVFAAWALITNAYATNLFPVIDIFSQSPAWALVVAVPVLSVGYLVGLICIAVTEAALVALKLTAPDSHDDERLHVLDQSPAGAARYEQVRQEAAVLSGSGAAILLLAVGVALHAARIPGWQRSLTSMAACAVLIAGASLVLGVRRRRKATHLLLALGHLKKPTSGDEGSVGDA